MKEKSTEKDFPMEWSAEEEIQLLYALDGLKPVGVNKHFNMFSISERLSRSLKRDIPTELIWTHVRTLYNLEELDEMEPAPFPIEDKEFSLPEEFAALMAKKRATSIGDDESGNSIIAVATDSSGKGASNTGKDEKKVNAKSDIIPKRAVKRTRGSASTDSTASPSVASPLPTASKRRRL